MKPFIVGVGGFSSDVGKTTLLCNLLSAFPGWEAIKTTRGHYRSCGKDPHACCVSDLLDDHAVVRSGHELTYQSGKDTGKYWDAGASNVHWVIATDAQVDQGVRQAIALVKSESVFVEGNTFTRKVAPDFFIMVVRPDKISIKSTARRAAGLISAIYISGSGDPSEGDGLNRLLGNLRDLDPKTPVFTSSTLPSLIKKIRQTRIRARQPEMSNAASESGLTIKASRC